MNKKIIISLFFIILPLGFSFHLMDNHKNNNKMVLSNNNKENTNEEKLLNMHSKNTTNFSVKGTKISFGNAYKPKINTLFSRKYVYKFQCSAHMADVIITVLNNKPVWLKPGDRIPYPKIDWKYYLKFYKDEYVIPELYVLDFLGRFKYDYTYFGDPFDVINMNNKQFMKRFNDIDFFNDDPTQRQYLRNDYDCNAIGFLVLIQPTDVYKVYETGYLEETIRGHEKIKHSTSTNNINSTCNYIEKMSSVDNYIETSKSDPYRLYPQFYAGSRPQVMSVLIKVTQNGYEHVYDEFSYLSKRHFRFAKDGYFDSSVSSDIDFTKALK